MKLVQIDQNGIIDIDIKTNTSSGRLLPEEQEELVKITQENLDSFVQLVEIGSTYKLPLFIDSLNQTKLILRTDTQSLAKLKESNRQFVLAFKEYAKDTTFQN